VVEYEGIEHRNETSSIVRYDLPNHLRNRLRELIGGGGMLDHTTWCLLYAPNRRPVSPPPQPGSKHPAAGANAGRARRASS
jgi:hypothetical protein